MLGLDLRLHAGQLRFYEPTTGPILTHQESEQARQEAKQALGDAEARIAELEARL